MPPVLVAGNGDKAMRRAAAYGDGWMSIGLSPEDIATGMATLRELAADHGRPTPRATVVGPGLGADPARAADRLAAYAEAGVERLILPPTGTNWRADYEFAARVRDAR
jgi:alkanesulfonate monooxygenase SsuD/methylene tetrahydromethanopterin reductase-like flavin-dependent oxidoreductase (luciferase family)